MLGCVLVQLKIASCQKIAAEPEVAEPGWGYPWSYAWWSGLDQTLVSALSILLSLGNPVDKKKLASYISNKHIYILRKEKGKNYW